MFQGNVPMYVHYNAIHISADHAIDLSVWYKDRDTDLYLDFTPFTKSNQNLSLVTA